MTRQTRQNKISRISFRRRGSRLEQYKENCLYISITSEVEKDKGEGKEKDNDYYNYKRHERRQK